MTRVTDPGSPLRAVRLATVVAIVAMMVFVAGSPARACSCAIDGVKAAISRSDGAFVGRWVDRADVGNGYAAVTFEVERVLKGSFGPKAIVRTNAQGSACGLEMLGPARTGLLLMKGPDGVWESDLCSMVKPSQLLAIGGDRPPDPGIAPVSVGWEPVSILAIVASAIVIVAVGLLLLGRRRRRPTASA
jgi:hypothetical protein